MTSFCWTALCKNRRRKWKVWSFHLKLLNAPPFCFSILTIYSTLVCFSLEVNILINQKLNFFKFWFSYGFEQLKPIFFFFKEKFSELIARWNISYSTQVQQQGTRNLTLKLDILNIRPKHTQPIRNFLILLPKMLMQALSSVGSASTDSNCNRSLKSTRRRKKYTFWTSKTLINRGFSWHSFCC